MAKAVVQNSLFGGAVVVSHSKPTRSAKWNEISRKVSEIYEKQSDSWKREVLRFAICIYLPGRKQPFLAEDLRKAYDEYSKENGLPLTVQSKAFTGVMHSLRKEKAIEKTGDVNYRENFVWATTYRSLI